MLRSVVIGLAFLLSACGQKIMDFDGRAPDYDLAAYFDGQTIGYGLFEDRFGKLRREFKVLIKGYEEDGELILEEDFLYNDGETQRRVWRIRTEGPHRYRGRAGDIIGTATGERYGNALRWKYKVDLKVGDGTWKVGFNDWMYLQQDGVLINKATVTRYGLRIGEVTIAFVKPGITATPETFVLQPRR